jgi:ribonuclease J
MKITIHRGTKEIGGSCVEICSGKTFILLDFGLPITFEFGDAIESALPEPIFSHISTGKKKIDGLLLSHAHLDHFGLVEALPNGIPIFLGKATHELIGFNDKFTPNRAKITNQNFIEDGAPFSIGGLHITPYQIDHSAFDAFAFHITDGDKSVFYTGDFRGHGLNRDLFERLIQSPPDTDVLLMEGTVIGEREEEVFVPESEIQQQLIKICNEKKGTVFVSAPSQNIDRMISLSQAAVETGRMFIIDLYSAELFDRLRSFSSRIPQPQMDHVLLWYPWFQRKILAENDLQWVMRKHREWKHTLGEIKSPYSKLDIHYPATLYKSN